MTSRESHGERPEPEAENERGKPDDPARRAATADPARRDITGYPPAADGSDFATVGQIFSAEHNPDRKKPFDIATVMRALSDQDHPVLERWAGMAGADTAVVQRNEAGLPLATQRRSFRAALATTRGRGPAPGDLRGAIPKEV